jgi:hypothetical protein
MKKHLIFSLFLAISTLSFDLTAQIYSNPNPGTYGFKFNRGAFGSTLHIPTTSSPPSSIAALNSVVSNQSALLYDSTGHNLYAWDPSLKTWKSTIGEPKITAGTTSQYWRGDKTWQTLPTYTLGGLGGVPTSRTLTINGTSFDLSVDRSWTFNSMVYPSAGIATSTGTAWGTSITDNSTNWNTAYSDRLKWDGGATGLVATTARTSLGLGSAAIANVGDFATASHSHSLASTSTNGFLSSTDWNTFNGKQNALGFTPYNSTNPAGYITGLSFAGLSAKPTTIAGYGITDAITTSSIGSQSVNYASSAGSVAWANVSGRPSSLSQFSNDLGNYGGWITSSGRAYPRRSDGGDLNFYWSGQGGQPTWLWGGNDGANMYVYNPSNFSVNYANSAGSAGSVAWGNVSGRPTALSQFSNDLGNYGGWITGINSGMVTSALGYTPYNSSNPAGYITSSSLSSYLPLSGGTISGNLTVYGNSATSGETYTGTYFKAGAGANEPYLWNPYGGDHWRATASAWYTYIGVGSVNFFSTSLRSSKTNIVPFTRSALDIINSVDVVEFNYKTDLENKRIGFIADDTVQELATKNHNQMDLNSSIGVLIKAVQEQQALIVDLKAQIEALKK